MLKAQAGSSTNRPWHSSECVGTAKDMCRIQHVLAALQVCKAPGTQRKQETLLGIARKEPQSGCFSRVRLTKSLTFKKKQIQKHGTHGEVPK